MRLPPGWVVGYGRNDKVLVQSSRMKQLNTHPGDEVTDLLSQIQVRSTVFCLSELRSPWGFRVEGRNVAKFHLMLEGGAWLMIDDREPRWLQAGDLVILPHGHMHSMRDDPSSRVEALDRILIDHPVDDGGRMYYGGEGALTRLLCGGFALQETAPGHLLCSLPDVIHVDARSERAGSWVEAVFAMLQDEADQSVPGAKAIFAKLADVFLTQALRTFLNETARTGLVDMTAALTDPAISEAVHLIASDLAADWSVGQLAYRVGMSRSAFSERFRELTGESPMRFVTRLRMAQGAGVLATTQRSVSSIAAECGYDSDSSFSKAFKREFDMTPGEYRETASRRPVLDVAAS